VIVLCGDRHWQYASHDSEIDLWEFGCGPGSEAHQLGWKPGDRRPVHEFLRVKGGFLSGQLRYVGKDRGPRLTLRHRRVDGAPVSEFVFPRPSPEAGSEGGDADQPESGADAPVQTVSEDAARERP
jgi:hypothetical protein